MRVPLAARVFSRRAGVSETGSSRGVALPGRSVTLDWQGAGSSFMIPSARWNSAQVAARDEFPGLADVDVDGKPLAPG